MIFGWASRTQVLVLPVAIAAATELVESLMPDLIWMQRSFNWIPISSTSRKFRTLDWSPDLKHLLLICGFLNAVAPRRLRMGQTRDSFAARTSLVWCRIFC